ncbi:MAG: hypothetical protein ACR2PT_05910 [Endozoicomonas sp.]
MQPATRQPWVGTRLVRFFGLRKVQAVDVTRQLPESVSREMPAETLRNRSIAIAGRHFVGFRSNHRNLDQLEAELVTSAWLFQPGLSVEHRRSKVRLAMAAAGMARLESSDPVTLCSKRRHLWNSQLSSQQFRRLESLLNEGDIEFFGRFDPKLAMTFPLQPLKPEELADIVGVDELPTESARIIRFRQCREYYLEGEGFDIIRELGATWLNELPAMLPLLETMHSFEGIQDFLSRLRQKTGSVKPTNPESLKEAKEQHRIDFDGQVVREKFKLDEPECRFLVVAEELLNQYRAVLLFERQDAVLEEDVQRGKAAEVQKEQLERVFTGLCHIVMKQRWPECFSDNHCQTLLLPDPERRDVVRWNSDNFQPRGGWFDKYGINPL